MTQVRVEVRKMTSGRAWLIVAVVLGVLMLGLPALVAMNISAGFSTGPDALPAGEPLPDTVTGYLYSFAGRVGYFAAFLLGAMCVAGEFGQRTIARTIVLADSRASVYLGKVVAVAAVSVLVGIVATAVSAGAAALVLTVQGYPTGLGDAAVVGILLRTPLAFALWGLIGLGLGALVRHQAAVLAIVLAFVVFIEPTLTTMSNENESMRAVAKFFPGAASWSLVWPPDGGQQLGGGNAVLGWVAGGLVLAAYAAVLASAGYLVGLRNRDITA